MKLAELLINVDGASSGNPGDAGIGIILQDKNAVFQETISRYIGQATNNVAEYTALAEALKRAKYLQAERIFVRSDSELMVKQIKGEYKVKNEGLKKIYQDLVVLIRQFPFVDVSHVKREDNKKADKLAKTAITEYRRANRTVAAQKQNV